jgi:hypothetical protein
VWRRYDGDGDGDGYSYGEHEDGQPFDGMGCDRPWPLLTGERSHCALLPGEDPLPYLEAMAAAEMSETEKLTVGALLTVLVLFVPGFVLHEAPRFPGSLGGSLLGIAGAALMVLLLIYPLVKHLAFLRQRVTKHVSMGTILTFHVYAGVLGALLGMLHTGHKFQSPLGITLVSSMLTVVLSGFVGRYYLAHLRVELRDQKTMLDTLRAEYDRMPVELAATAVAGSLLGPLRQWAVRLVPAFTGAPAIPVRQLVAAIAELEYAMRRREAIQRAFAAWMFVHIAAAIVMYSALGLHIWNGVYFGLRWLQ